MNRIALSMSFIFLFFLTGGSAAAQVIVPVRLADVRTVYVDERSFKITTSSCGTYAGGYYLPCPQQSAQRVKFLASVKRWLGKLGFTVVDDKKTAEGILEGTLSIDDHLNRDGTYGPERGPSKNKHRDRDKLPDLDTVPSEYRQAMFEPRWSVTAWLTNQDGHRLWVLGTDYPGISYSGEKGKIEGKKLAKAIEYDFKHHI